MHTYLSALTYVRTQSDGQDIEAAPREEVEIVIVHQICVFGWLSVGRSIEAHVCGGGGAYKTCGVFIII
jgi:hypothetical protein